MQLVGHLARIFLEFVDDEECRNSVQQVAVLIRNTQNVTAAAIAAAKCIPACQSLIDLEIECLGQRFVDFGAA